MEDKKIKVAMTFLDTKKHSVRFKANKDQTTPALTMIYLMNDCFKAIGNPGRVVVTIEAVE